MDDIDLALLGDLLAVHHRAAADLIRGLIRADADESTAHGAGAIIITALRRSSTHTDAHLSIPHDDPADPPLWAWKAVFARAERELRDVQAQCNAGPLRHFAPPSDPQEAADLCARIAARAAATHWFAAHIWPAEFAAPAGTAMVSRFFGIPCEADVPPTLRAGWLATEQIAHTAAIRNAADAVWGACNGAGEPLANWEYALLGEQPPATPDPPPQPSASEWTTRLYRVAMTALDAVRERPAPAERRDAVEP